MRQDVFDHARMRPRRGIARRRNASVGKAAFFGNGVAPFEYGHIMSIQGQLVGGGDAHNARSNNGELQKSLL